MIKITQIKWLAWFLLCAALQSTLVPYIAILSVMPDLLMLAFFSFVIKSGIMRGTYVGFILGLGFDLFSPGVLGQNALAMTVTGFVCGHFNERVLRLDPVMRAVLMLGAFVINDSTLMIVHMIKTGGGAGTIFVELLVSTLPRALYTLLFAAVIYVFSNIVKPARLTD